MSMNLYLNRKIYNDKGFIKKEDSNGSHLHSLHGIPIQDEKGILYVVHPEEIPIPDELNEYITKVSLWTQMSAERATRETGIYKLGGSEADVQIVSESKGRVYTIKIVGEKFDSVYELLKKIRTGSIRPVESYEGKQCGLSRVELEEEMARKQLEIETLNNKIAELEGRLDQVSKNKRLQDEQLREIQTVLANMSKARWPLCA